MHSAYTAKLVMYSCLKWYACLSIIAKCRKRRGSLVRWRGLSATKHACTAYCSLGHALMHVGKDCLSHSYNRVCDKRMSRESRLEVERSEGDAKQRERK